MKFIIIFALCINVNCFAEENTRSLDDHLLNDEWEGPLEFIKNLNNMKQLGSCNYLVDTELRFKNVSSVVRRLLLASSYKYCKENLSLASKYMNSKNPLLRESAIRLAASLPDQEKASLKAKILELDSSDKDPAVVAAINKFLGRSKEDSDNKDLIKAQ